MGMRALRTRAEPRDREEVDETRLCMRGWITGMEWDHGRRWAERRGGCGPSHRAKPSIRLIVPILLPAMPLLLPVPFSAIAKSALALDSLSLLFLCRVWPPPLARRPTCGEVDSFSAFPGCRGEWEA
jgi:hypothetical protein